MASFDPEGLIFAVGVQSEQIKLYDVRSFEKGPFSTFKYKIENGCDWTGVKFSQDGKLMMLTTNGAVVRVVEAFEGKPMFTLSGYQNNKGIHIEASFTPDSQYVISGSTDGKLHLWRTDTGHRIGILTGEHSHPVTNVQFNPRYVKSQVVILLMFFCYSSFLGTRLWRHRVRRCVCGSRAPSSMTL